VTAKDEMGYVGVLDSDPTDTRRKVIIDAKHGDEVRFQWFNIVNCWGVEPTRPKQVLATSHGQQHVNEPRKTTPFGLVVVENMGKPRKTWLSEYGWLLLLGVVFLIVYGIRGGGDTPPSSPSVSSVNATTDRVTVEPGDRRFQILHPQVDFPREGITIVTGFTEGGRRVVAETDGEGSCNIGLPDADVRYDDASKKIIAGREFPNNNPIFLTIYSDGSGGRLDQRTRDGSIETCGVMHPTF